MQKKDPAIDIPPFKLPARQLGHLSSYCERQTQPRLRWIGMEIDSYIGMSTAVGLYSPEDIVDYAEAKEEFIPVDPPPARTMARLFVTADMLRRSRLTVELGFSEDFKAIAQAVVDIVSYSDVYTAQDHEDFIDYVQDLAELADRGELSDNGKILGGFYPMADHDPEAPDANKTIYRSGTPPLDPQGERVQKAFRAVMASLNDYAMQIPPPLTDDPTLNLLSIN